MRRICGDTALFGQAIERLLDDRDFVVEALLGYYVRFEPGSLFVAVEGGAVIGYLAGCVDTRRFDRLFSRRILPGLMMRFVSRGHWRRAESWRILMALARAGRARSRLLRSVLDPYPAHCHMNIAEGRRRGGAGSLLLARFLTYLEERSVPGIHVWTASGEGKAFFLKKGFGELGRCPAPRLPLETPDEVFLLGRAVSSENRKVESRGTPLGRL